MFIFLSCQTMEQRVRTQKLKDKRKAAMDARLAKVRERKLKKLKASGELSEESVETNGQLQRNEKEQKDSEDTRETTTSEQNVEEGSLEKEEEHVDMPRRPLKKEDLPEWARHKISKLTDMFFSLVDFTTNFCVQCHTYGLFSSALCSLFTLLLCFHSTILQTPFNTLASGRKI